MALAQSDLVDINFLATYLGKIVRLKNPNFRHRVDPELVKMLISKCNDPDMMSNLSNRGAAQIISVAASRADEELGDLAIKVFEKDTIHNTRTLTEIHTIINRIKDQERQKAEQTRVIELCRKNVANITGDNKKAYDCSLYVLTTCMFDKTEESEKFVKELLEQIDTSKLSFKQVKAIIDFACRIPRHLAHRDELLEKLCEIAMTEDYLKATSLGELFDTDIYLNCVKTDHANDYLITHY